MTLFKTLRRLLANRSGVAMTEFALGAPFLLGAGLWGVETANFAVTNMKIGQLAVHLADNASRIGDTATLQNRKLYEEDITDVLLGANLQGGTGLDLYQHGRVIISSVEIWDDSAHCNASGCASAGKSNGTQFVHWQRCKGALARSSLYATQNQDLPGGIGPSGQEVSATGESPVIFVEVFYDYQPLIDLPWTNPATITSTAAFIVRDSRDLSEVYERNAASQPSDCSSFDTFAATTP
jgi:hypothetical protein